MPILIVHSVLAVLLTLQVVVVGVLCHATVEEGPREVVHCILLVLNGLGDHFSIEVVVKKMIEVGLRERGKERQGYKHERDGGLVTHLHWQRLIEKLLVELLLRGLAHQHSHTCGCNDNTVNSIAGYNSETQCNFIPTSGDSFLKLNTQYSFKLKLKFNFNFTRFRH